MQTVIDWIYEVTDRLDRRHYAALILGLAGVACCGFSVGRLVAMAGRDAHAPAPMLAGQSAGVARVDAADAPQGLVARPG